LYSCTGSDFPDRLCVRADNGDDDHDRSQARDSHNAARDGRGHARGCRDENSAGSSSRNENGCTWTELCLDDRVLALDRSGLCMGSGQLGGTSQTSSRLGGRPMGAPARRLGLYCWSLAGLSEHATFRLRKVSARFLVRGRARNFPRSGIIWSVQVGTLWNDPSFGSEPVKPTCQFEKKQFPKTDCFFHSGMGEWRGYSWPYDGDEGSEFRRFHDFSRKFLIESARERTKEMVVFAIVVLASAWPVIYMIVTVVKLLLKGRLLANARS
jgi:hypothetical protein